MRLIFRLIRMIGLCLVAFVVGIFYERAHQQSLCDTSGGIWTRAGVCAVEVTDG